jgi:DNA-binding response OmpR family regulator
VILTQKQIDVLELVFIGKTNGEIAQILGVCESAARGMVYRITQALGSYNRCNAVYNALKLGLLKPPEVCEQPAPPPLPQPRELATGALHLDPATHRVTVSGKRLPVSDTEYRVLEFFLRHPGRVFDRNSIIDNVWDAGCPIEMRTVDVHIRRLRKALEAHGLEHLIQTERGVGYFCEKAAA